MTVLELISQWTAEERKLHMELILECLERERSLMDSKRAIKGSEEKMKQSLDLLSSRLSNLAQAAKQNADQIQNVYLLLVKGQGNV